VKKGSRYVTFTGIGNQYNFVSPIRVLSFLLSPTETAAVQFSGSITFNLSNDPNSPNLVFPYVEDPAVLGSVIKFNFGGFNSPVYYPMNVQDVTRMVIEAGEMYCVMEYVFENEI